MVRPRTSVPEDKELIKLGEDLVKWAAEKKEGELRCRWCEWFSRKHFFVRAQWKHMIEKDSFRPYYEMAKSYLGEKWIDGTIHQSIAQRYLRLYDPELSEEEDKVADAEVIRKASALKSETRAIEEEKQKVLSEVQRNKRKAK